MHSATELEASESITQTHKKKASHSLLHKIRIIQGHTHLNYTEPHFVESKDSVSQTKELIHNIKEGVRKGCSDVLRSARDRTRFISDTSSSLTGNETSIKKRQLKCLLGYPNRAADKNDSKIELKKSKNLYNVCNALYEYGERQELVSQVVGKEMEKGLHILSDTMVEGKTAKKKKRRKRKMNDIEITSSMTIAPSKVNVRALTQGDARPLRLKPRKNRDRYKTRKRPECSGDESDIEDNTSCRLTEFVETRVKIPRRRMRVKNPPMTSNSELTENEKDIRQMVSSTIDKLNTVNDHVQKVIEDSLSSEPSFVIEKPLLVRPAKLNIEKASRTGVDEGSVTSSNWSTASISISTLVDVSEISRSVSLQTHPTVKKHSQTQATIRSAPVKNEKKPTQPPRPATSPMPPTKAPVHAEEGTGAEQVASPRPKRKKHKNDAPKVENAIVEVVLPKEVPKKKKSTASKTACTAEPVSSMKKSGKKKKDKKKEHVNFVTTPPEVVPDFHVERASLPLSKKSTKIVNANADENQKQQKSPAKSPPQDAAVTVKKTTSKSTRRVSSAKTYRQVNKNEVPKVKSTGNLNPTHKEETPITVRSVLAEEANSERKRSNSKPRNGSSGGSRGHSPRSRSGSRESSRPRSKSGGKRDEILKSKDVREIYYKIRTNTTNTIANINEQMSSTLKESIAHLNDICGKVRNTLTDMEKDEQTYRRLKSKQSFEVSSEGGGSTISVQNNQAQKDSSPGISGDKPSIKAHTYTVISPSAQDSSSIGRLMSTISMAGDNLMREQEEREVTTPTTPSREKKKRRSRDSKKRPSSKQQLARPKALVATVSSSKTKFGNIKNTISNDKASLAKIPIWQRKPPSVIEEIQLTVKKQATKSQYREFLKALKSIAKKQRSQVHVVPQEFREVMEKQQDKAFDSISKHKLVGKKKKDIKPMAEFNKICKVCPPDKCTCGVTVENSIMASNLQRSNWMHTRSDRKGIQVYDILDEITLKDVEPIQSEYPRKDHISDADASKRVEDTLLYKLLYNEDPKVLESLLKSSCPPVEEYKSASKLCPTKAQERPKSVSDAYRLYEQLEFNGDKQPSLNLTPTKGSICLKSKDTSKEKPKEKPRALDTCTKDFNDNELVIPDDLKPTMKNQVNPVKKPPKRKFYHKLRLEDEIASRRSRKRIEDKLKVIAKSSSIKSIDRRNRKNKFSKENIKTRLKNYSVDSKVKIKRIITVMPISIVQNKDRLKRGKMVNVERSEAQREMKISAENMEKINRMSKREIVKILKPYIFYDLQPPVITVMPVQPKYNYQNKHQRQDSDTRLPKGPTLKKVLSFLKEHDDECCSGKKLCRRCQMVMQSGDEMAKRNQSMGTKKFPPLSQKQLWKYKYRATPAENLINRVLGKKGPKKKFQAVPSAQKKNSQEILVGMTPKQLNRNAASTRSKLNDIKNIMESNKPLLGQHLDDIIDALEFRIVDALSNPKNHHTKAFNEIEGDIKSILSTISNLKQINREHMRKNSGRLKSQTNVQLDDMNEIREMKSKTDINLNSSVSRLLEGDASMAKNEADFNPILEEEAEEGATTEEEEDIVGEEEGKKIDSAYSNLGKDIEKVIDGLDAIMTIDENVAFKEEEEETPTVALKVTVQSKGCNSSMESDDAMSTFCEQMDEALKNIGNSDDLDASTDTLDTFLAEDLQEKKSDEYLTPFMKTVRNYRRNEQTHSFIEFLDKLTMLSKDTVPMTVYPRLPIHQATIKRSSQVIEIAKTYNQAIQCEEGGLIADEFVEMGHNHIGTDANADILPKSDQVLSTNRWMQTEETGPCNEEFEEVKDCLIQTSSTEEQFNEVEEYLGALDCGTASQKIMLISEKNTQVPSGPDHTCFARSSSKDVQVTADLREMGTVAVQNQTHGMIDDELISTPTSAECQIGSDPDVRDLTPGEFDESATTEDTEEVATVDMAKMEKYTNRIDSCFDGDTSEISYIESPRSAHTDSYIAREKNSLLRSDVVLCDKANSYPTTKISSNIISLFESHKSSNDTNYTRDFLEDGFSKSAVDSYDSMLARCESSDLVSQTPSSVSGIKTASSDPSALKSKQTKRADAISVKLVSHGNEDDYRHKHLLHSVYGIVFVLMFLSINLNYGCYN